MGYLTARRIRGDALRHHRNSIVMQSVADPSHSPRASRYQTHRTWPAGWRPRGVGNRQKDRMTASVLQQPHPVAGLTYCA